MFQNNVIAGASGQGGGSFYPTTIDQSLRFEDGDSAYLNKTLGSGDQTEWTWSAWVKRCSLSSDAVGVMWHAGQVSGTNVTSFRFASTDKIRFYNQGAYFDTDAVYRDTSAWYHVVIAFDSDNATTTDRAKIYVNGVRQTGTWTGTSGLGYTNGPYNHAIGYYDFAGWKFDGYMADIHFIDGQALTADDFGETKNGVWVAKDYAGTYGTNGFYLDFSATATQFPITANGAVQHSTAQSKTGASSILFDGNGDYLETPANSEFALGTGDFTIEGWFYHNNSSLPTYEHLWGNYSPSGAGYAGNYALQFNYGSNVAYLYYGNGLSYSLSLGSAFTAQTWHHVAIVRSSGTTTLYIDGVSKASTSDSADYKSQQPFCIGNYRDTAEANSFNGYIDEFRISKVARYTSGFTPSTTTFESDSDTLYLVQSDTTNGSTTFTDSSGVPSGLGNEVSGNGNHWTVNNIDYTDQVPDSPTNNFATYNPLHSAGNQAEGNLKTTAPGTNWYTALVTQGITSGKWYAEFYYKRDGAGYAFIGVAKVAQPQTINAYLGEAAIADADSYGYYSLNGNIYNQGAQTAYGNSYTDGDVIGLALDMDAGNLYFYKNGTIQNSGTAAATGLTGTMYIGATSYSTSDHVHLNTGQDSTFAGLTTAGGNSDANGIGDFKYSVPSGYLALCTSNLPDPVIDPAQGSSPEDHFNTVLYTGNSGSQTISGVGFAPDLVWAKNRTTAGYHHELYDILRGDNKRIFSSQTDAELTGYLALESDGFSLTSGGGINASGDAHVAWNWKAGGTGVSNTDGSITSTVSANTDAGFSIATYTTQSSGTATVGHGLSQPPEVLLVKATSTAFQWDVYHAAIGEDAYLVLNTTAGATTGATSVWNSTAPTSSVFSLGTAWASAVPGATTVAYCFHSVDGFSKMGSYVGNGNADGAFVYTGFRPKMVIWKRTNVSGQSWEILDVERDPYNGVTRYLYPDTSGAENNATAYPQDFLSNGFKIRHTGASANASGGTYIYMAFAENPFKYANAR